MLVLPPNVILFICAGVVGSILGFIIYGLIVGFENTFEGSKDKPRDR
jgi:hypothetical protein